jgi:hypothetical protein
MNAPETAESKRLSRTDSDSLLAILSKNLEASLQEAFDLAAKFNGKEAPIVQIDRDFDLQVLDGNQVAQYLQLWQNGAISHETLLQSLKRGEVLPQIEVDAEIEMTQQEKLDGMAMAIPVGNPAENDQSDIRSIMEERVRNLTGNDEDDSDDDDGLPE